ncbi:hypothetical protein [Pseudoscardovia radai]|uniref:hypothetical protein n=1 Tax=Pseudoscardovia radai TaxID=987066 RepID=UPI0039926756
MEHGARRLGRPGAAPLVADPVREAHARRRTALTLISVADYATAERIWGGQAWGMACELDVTLQVLDDFRRILHDRG